MITTLSIQGMHCASCKLLIEDVCGDMPGVTSCVVDAPAGSVRIEHDASANVETIRHEIEQLGDYHTSLRTE